ncbi:MAG: hypothetical protein QHH02_07935 [Syntrophomonadaceae bacterium]|nr:hypothetical protein [Syntrophomonadaceae bacterium]
MIDFNKSGGFSMVFLPAENNQTIEMTDAREDKMRAAGPEAGGRAAEPGSHCSGIPNQVIEYYKQFGFDEPAIRSLIASPPPAGAAHKPAVSWLFTSTTRKGRNRLLVDRRL